MLVYNIDGCAVHTGIEMRKRGKKEAWKRPMLSGYLSLMKDQDAKKRYLAHNLAV